MVSNWVGKKPFFMRAESMIECLRAFRAVIVLNARRDLFSGGGGDVLPQFSERGLQNLKLGAGIKQQLVNFLGIGHGEQGMARPTIDLTCRRRTSFWIKDSEMMKPVLALIILFALNFQLKAQVSAITNTVVVWGKNINGIPLNDVTNVPPGLTNVVAIAAGTAHVLALNDNGTVVAWGDDNCGEIDVPLGLSNVVAIAAGYCFSLALIDDGTVVAWGSDSVGQTNVPPGLSNVVAIAAAGNDSLALKGDGTVVAWGDNTYGATSIPPGLSNVVAIAANVDNYQSYYSLALKVDGTVVAWGLATEATNVPPDLTNLMAIADGDLDNWALKGDGTIATWNDNGILVDDPPPGLTNVTAIAPDLALLGNGTVIAWGNGQVSVATNVPTSLTNVVAIAANGSIQPESYDLALVRDGFPVVLGPVSQLAYSGAPVVMIATAVGAPPLSYQWQFNGTNITGAIMPWLTLTNVQLANAGNYSVVLGNGSGVVTGSTAGLVVSNAAPIILNQPNSVEVTLGDNTSISVVATGSRPLSYQWQFNGANIPGATNVVIGLANVQGTNAGSYSVVVSNVYGTNVSSSATLSFVLTSVVAWGLDNYGQTYVPPSLTNVVAVAAGSGFSMALNADGTVVAWGDETNVPTGLTNVVAIAGGLYSSMAVKSDGTVVTWYQYEYGPQTNVPPVPPGLSNVVAVAAAYDGSGGDFCLALKDDGTVAAWGSDVDGETNVPPNLTNAVAITAGIGFSVALKADHTVVAWGTSYGGVTNVPADLTNVVAIGAGPTAQGSLAVKADGTVEYWGYPSQVNQVPSGLTNVVAVSVGGGFGMAFKADHTVVTWGDNTFGECDIPPGLTNVIAIAAGSGHAVVLDPAGGALTLIGGSVTAGNPAYVTALLSPPAAVQAGAGWQLQGDGNNYANSGDTLVVTARSTTIEFKPISGWNTPIGYAVPIIPGNDVVSNLSYTVIPPVFAINTINGIGLTGTTGTTYLIEYSTNLASGQWLPLETNTLGAGLNTLLPWPPTNEPAAFYRAIWLP
jgi:alpha-tubulin suppressor-like RCC1 family protein